MRYSRFLIPTLKENPSDAQTPSHIYLLRGGYIRQVAAGVFSLLPLGMRVVDKIKKMVREELNQIGACEVLLPMVHPAPLWQESGRWQVYGPQLLRFKDRKGFEFALSPTAEEAMVDLVRNEVKTYRKLPVHLYQIQDKFRDEDRPRAGLLRGREFIMKDGYSFHADEQDAMREYQATYQAYSRIFSRCGLDFRAVEADTGAIGGSLSHEFQVLADTGEDHIVSCSHCGYAANVEKAVLKREFEAKNSSPPSKERQDNQTQNKHSTKKLVHTPNIKTITEVSSFFQVTEQQTLKTLIYLADKNPIAVVIRGDRHLNEPKLKTFLKANELEPASESFIKQLLQAEAGSLGPLDLQIPLYADWEIAEEKPFIVGANQTDYHYAGVTYGVDFTAELIDIRVAATGDTCGKCGQGTYRSHRGIEVGHVFFLGTKYSAPMHCEFLDQAGKLAPMIMGTYGIGITRIMASAIEQRHDDKGICWPIALAPFQVVITSLGQEPEIVAVAEKLYQDLLQAGIEVLYDDREERAGIKFADAELIGIPLRITLGKRALSEKQIEIKSRDGKLNTHLPLESEHSNIQDFIRDWVAKQLTLETSSVSPLVK